MNNETPSITVFIGFDERQPEAFKACKQSILENSAICDVTIIPLKHKELREKGLFNREWTVKANGQYIDNVDGKPFSTQFSHTRFLVPHLSKTLSDRFTVFVDSDFIFTTDIAYLVLDTVDPANQKPVYCVKHNYTPKTATKMDNCLQAFYNKKLWTSLLLFDNSFKETAEVLSPETVNREDGNWLHTFKWLGDDSKIGSINESWNYIPDHSKISQAIPNAIHYTEGVPHMKGYEKCEFYEQYLGAYHRALKKECDDTSTC